MYRAIAPSVLKELEEIGEEIFSVKNTAGRGPDDTPWLTMPFKISFLIGTESEHIFDCFIQKYDSQMYVNHVEPAGILRSGEPGLIDAYLYLTIKKAIRFAQAQSKTQLIFDSYIPATAEHLVDLGFELYPNSNYLHRGVYHVPEGN